MGESTTFSHYGDVNLVAAITVAAVLYLRPMLSAPIWAYPAGFAIIGLVFYGLDRWG